MTFKTLDRLLGRFAEYPPERIRLFPNPGTATIDDVIAIERDEGVLCELIDGVLVEKTVGFKEAYLALEIGRWLGNYAELHDLGIVLGADGTAQLFPGQVRIPDTAFYAWAKLPGRKIPEEPIPNIVPDLAIEVISRSNSKGEMREKLNDYFTAGVRLVWYVDRFSETIEVYTAVDALTTLTSADTLTGGEVLPGYSLPVSQLFAL